MALPTIIYNAASGSDTAASGSNAPTTPLTGTTATVNGGDPGTLIDLDGSPDLTLLNDDDSDVIYLATSAGNRHLSRILTVDNINKRVTIEDSVSLSTGVSWAIGGKRKTLENDTSNKDWVDGKEGWTWEFEDGTYALTSTAAWVGTTTTTVGPTTIKAASGASPVFTQSANVPIFTLDASEYLIKGLKLELVTGALTAANGISAVSSSRFSVIDCTIDTKVGVSGSGGYGIISLGSSIVVTLINCKIHSNLECMRFTGRACLYALNCDFFDAEFSDCVTFGSSAGVMGAMIDSCIFRGAVAHGLSLSSTVNVCNVVVKNSVFYNNGSAGLDFKDWSDNVNKTLTIFNCIFINNGTYGIDADASASEVDRVLIDYNAFFANTSGARNNITAGDKDVILTADPFVDASNGDFSLNDDPNGGRLCKAAGIPGIGYIGSGQGLTDGVDSYTDLGVSQLPAVSILNHPSMTGGING